MLQINRIHKGSRFIISSLEIDGTDLTRDYLDNLKTENVDEWGSVLRRIEKISENEKKRNNCQMRSVKGFKGLYEIKTKESRITCFYDEGALIICVSAFKKPQPKKQQNFFKTANKKMKTYFEEKGNNDRDY